MRSRENTMLPTSHPVTEPSLKSSYLHPFVTPTSSGPTPPSPSQPTTDTHDHPPCVRTYRLVEGADRQTRGRGIARTPKSGTPKRRARADRRSFRDLRFPAKKKRKKSNTGVAGKEETKSNPLYLSLCQKKTWGWVGMGESDGL